MTRRLLEHAPRLSALATAGWVRSLDEVIPAVTCTAQATLLTGELPRAHGIVANGWLFRETREVRFWQQANPLLQAEPLYATARLRARDRGRPFRAAKLFWWFNQGADVDVSVTPKPYYAADGNKAFGIAGTPDGLCERLETTLGHFPFPSFWGPTAGLPSTRWIARCAAEVVRDRPSPDLTLVYLPHLDYDPQRFGPAGCDMPRLVRELDDACEPLLDACRAACARAWVVSEYGHCDVKRAVEPNRLLRKAGLLTVRPGPFGEGLDLFASRAFAVCDHQLAHVYVRDPADLERAGGILETDPGIARVLVGPQRAEVGLDHPRSGEIIALSAPDAWFAYPFWLDDRQAPDYARTVDIHRKPGYDPCELFFDPRIRLPKLRAARRLLQKRLGFRTLFDLVPLDSSLVRGSHGLCATTIEERPILFGDGAPPTAADPIAMTRVAQLLLEALGLPD
jgi:predicted AlkP superfamily pyrophosphatase or phosphodiesterase